MSNLNTVNNQLLDVALRIREMREIVGYSIEEMAEKTEISQRVGIWCEPINPFLSTHPFRAGELNPKHSRFSRLPALRDSACWSVKWRRNMAAI